MDATTEGRLNTHLNAELQAEYMYMGMAAYLGSIDMPGAASWMLNQASEEREHAMKFYNHIEERGGRVVLKTLDGPPEEFGSVLDVFKTALTHEQKVTKMIHDLVDMAIKNRDHATNAFLQWFVTEQVEEEDNARQIISQLERVGDHGPAILRIDRHLGMRSSE